jgi:hypothetical protein
VSIFTRQRLDVFYIGLLRDAPCDGLYDLPWLEKSSHVPLDLISFPKRRHANDAQWMHFYVDDYEFVFPLRYPPRLLGMFRRVAGVITPDYSLFSDLPFVKQIDAVFNGRVLGYWLQKNGVKVIPNLRWCDERSYSFAFDGIPQGGTVAVGSHGCVRDPKTRRLFLDGFNTMIERIHPEAIVVYGPVLKEMEGAAGQGNVRIVGYASEMEMAHPKEPLWDRISRMARLQGRGKGTV